MFVNSGVNIPSNIMSLLEEQKANEISIDVLENLEELKSFLEKYAIFKDDIRNGLHGKTAQFWTVCYLDLMKNQHKLHYAVQTNNYELRLEALKYILPFCFALNKQNYARYGSIYINSLQNLDVTPWV